VTAHPPVSGGRGQATTGPLALIGGGAWEPGAKAIHTSLIEASGVTEAILLPTAAAYEHPERLVAHAAEHLAALGVKIRPLSVFGRPDAFEPGASEAVSEARLIYLDGSSPLHLCSVLKSTPLWDALVKAWHHGATIAGSSAGAMVLGDPMIDPRGGALTVGLGLIDKLAVMPHADTWSPEKAQRTVSLATGGLRIVAIDEQTALIRDAAGGWTIQGRGRVVVHVDSAEAGLDALP
jgi:cyanophycinase